MARAIEELPSLPVPEPQIGDDIAQWLDPRAIRVLHAHGIKTLADLTVRIPRRRRWWTAVPGLGVTGARSIEAFFAAHPSLTERARALIAMDQPVRDNLRHASLATTSIYLHTDAATRARQLGKAFGG